MTNLQREALDVFIEVLELSPDIRLGQLMAHLGFLGDAHLDKGLGNIEDDELIAVLYRHRAELQARMAGTSPQFVMLSGTTTSVSGSPTIPDVLPAV